MKNLVVKTFLILCIIGLTYSQHNCVLGQEQEEDRGYDVVHRYEVPEEKTFFKKTIWRRMDLTEPQNASFYVTDHGITSAMISGVKFNKLTPYLNDSLTTKISKEEFYKNLQVDEGEDVFDAPEGVGADAGGDDGWGEDEVASTANQTQYYLPSELTVLKIKENLIFDLTHSQMKYNIVSLELVIPANITSTGLEKTVAAFDFKELEVLLRDRKIITKWHNSSNDAKNMNLADAFMLRLFNARIYKISNPKDSPIEDLYNLGPKEALMKSQQIEHQLIEYEATLWEY